MEGPRFWQKPVNSCNLPP